MPDECSLPTGSVLKFGDPDQRTITGWASVVEEGGVPVEDRQGDIIPENELIKAAHDYLLDSRSGKIMHQGKRVADVVESMVMTKDLQKALGIEIVNKSGKQMVGWLITMKFRDAKDWEAAKSGKYTSFSIGGVGQRIPVEVA